MEMARCLALIVIVMSVGAFGKDVKCVDKLSKRIHVFKAEENHTDPYHDVIFDIPANHCFIDEPIALDDNETLSIHSVDAAVITTITFAIPSTLPEFPLEMFTTFPNLSDARLLFTGIEVIEEDDFVNATALTHLRLEQNNIKRISRTAFSQATKLQSLRLPANNIHEIEDFAFASLKDLTKLDLQQNNLTILREHILAGANNLTEIFLNANQIESIEDGALYFEKLTRLSLQDNRLKTLSPNLLTGAPLLYGIDLSSNLLESVHGVFDKCPDLTIIGLDRNRIETIDVLELANIPSLRVLSLAGNKIKLNSNVSAADIHTAKTQLEYLNIASNNISSPSFLEELHIFHKLKFLNLDNNEITKIDVFKHIRVYFPNFIQINLNGNPLECGWLDDDAAFIEAEQIIINSIEREINSTEATILPSNQKKVNGVICTIKEN